MVKRKFAIMKQLDMPNYKAYPFIICMGLSLLFLILSFLLWIISAIVKKQFILSEMLGNYCGLTFMLCFTFTFCLFLIGTKNILGRIASIFAIIIFISVGTDFYHASHLLYKDRMAYENKQYETKVGVPVKVEYDNPDSGPEWLFELVFKDKTLFVHHLQISRNDYDAHFKDKPLEILYLPNSLYAVEIKVHTN
ncbi:hypothetical protein [Cytobacillus massiliigabonensis]|uniref:hypothetical protein n=1 Tax=Cytobacillus massiliigabonensis TaxID=1871011 RepID=UPI000C84FB0C|nr:hypothetical protein [Cytobacillus massiliigabonensis]